MTGDYSGPGTVAGYTVLYQGDEPWRGIAVIDLPDGKRTVAFSESPDIIQPMLTRECIGDACRVADGQLYYT